MSNVHARVARVRAPRFAMRPLLVALATAGILAPLPGYTANIKVTSGGDAGAAGTCTLRQAVTSLNGAALVGNCANTGAAFGTNDTVDLSAFSGTITLAGTELTVSKDMTFLGAASPQTVVLSGGGASRVIDASNTDLTITNLTLTKGKSVGSGGCIFGDFVTLNNSIVTGCEARKDPLSTTQPSSGGGISAYGLTLNQSTVSGNIADGLGGGVIGKYVYGYGSVVTGNTVVGGTCSVVDSNSSKYCQLKGLGGGGILAFGTVGLVSSTVSGNTVNAVSLVNASDATQNYIAGFGGGISLFSGAAGTVAKRAPVVASKSLAAFQARHTKQDTPHAKAAGKAREMVAGKIRAKADGYGEYIVGLVASTVSGNVVKAPAVVNPATRGKYGGGGVLAITKYNSEIANSTISGNVIPLPRANGISYSYGSGFLASGADFTNSTVTANFGPIAVLLQGQLSSPQPVKKAASRAAQFRSRMASRLQSVAPALKVPVLADITPPALDSTIIGGNNNFEDFDCGGCTVTGSKNLIQLPSSGQGVPGDTIVNQDPKLAPLGNNGGVVNGAAGDVATGPVKTHILYFTSPAIDKGSNLVENFTYDQRGPGFPRTTGAATDIGAVEGAVPLPAPAAVVDVPALGPWMLGLLSALVAGFGALRRRRSS